MRPPWSGWTLLLARERGQELNRRRRRARTRRLRQIHAGPTGRGQRCPTPPGHTYPLGTGTPTERAVPFGAFSHLVAIADIGKPAALLRAARASLSGEDGEGDLLLIVDDAHNLDILSATLVYQLALAGTARMIVTARGPDLGRRPRPSRRCGRTVC